MKVGILKKTSPILTNSKENRLFNIVNVTLLALFTILIVFPIWNIVALSFNDAQDSVRGGIYFWPRKFSLESYRLVFASDDILQAALISVSKTAIGIVTHVAFTACVAYGLSKKGLFARGLYIKMGIFTMFFSGGIVPVFLLIRGLGLYNNFWVYIIPVLFSFYDMIIFMNFFRAIPASLEESAEIDGADVWQCFVRIILPLSTPVLATIALFNGVSQWNDYMTARFYINDESLFPLQMKIYEIIVQSRMSEIRDTAASVVLPTTPQSIQLATIVVATVPIVLIYPFLQRYFISGMTLGAVKG